MESIIYQLAFFLVTLYILLKVIGFAIYEIKMLNNKSGGIAVIVFSTIIVLCFDVIILFKWNLIFLYLQLFYKLIFLYNM